jgi:hypothetical protein
VAGKAAVAAGTLGRRSTVRRNAMRSNQALLIGTLAAVIGCDAGDAEPETPRDHDGESAEDPDQVCDLVAIPSVYLLPVRVYDDYTMMVDADAVWYEWRGETYEATCLPDRHGKCIAWIAGYEREGEVRVFTEYCDDVVETVVEVPIDEDGCHVVTQHLLQPVTTRGCFTTETRPEEPPI